LRRILKIRWNYFVSNAEVLKRANIAPVDVFIRVARLMRWFGHVSMWCGCQRKEYPNTFCIGSLSMAKGPGALPAKTG
jgi:hypothetical protein